MGKSRALGRSEGIRCLSRRLWTRPTIVNSSPTAKRPVRRWSSNSIGTAIRRISFPFGGNAAERLGRRAVNDNPQKALLRIRIRRSGDDLSFYFQYGSHAARTVCPSCGLGRKGEYPLGRNDSI